MNPEMHVFQVKIENPDTCCQRLYAKNMCGMFGANIHLRDKLCFLMGQSKNTMTSEGVNLVKFSLNSIRYYSTVSR